LRVGFQHQLYAVLAKQLGHFVCDVRILAGKQLLVAVHDRHPAPEAPKHLGELEADIPAAEHKQVVRHRGKLHHRRGVQSRDAVQPRKRGPGRPFSRVDKDLGGRKLAEFPASKAHFE